MTRHNPLRGFGPVLPVTHRADLLRAGGGSAAALLIVGLALWALGDAAGPHLRLIAPFGASAVLLFAIPNSPLAQPWSALVGNSISAIAAVAVLTVLPAGPWVPGIAVGVAITAMLLARALHPPGGAVALLIALDPGHASPLFALAPVAVGTAGLIGLAVLWHLATGRVYPFRQSTTPGAHGTTDSAPPARIGLDEDDLARILDQYRQSANLGVADLARLIGAAEQVAAEHRLGPATCKQIMSRDLVTVRPNAPLAEVAGIFRDRGFHSLPVVTERGVLVGVIFQIDLIRRARADALRLNRGFAAAFARLIDHARKGGHTAADVMTVAVPRATPDTPIGAVVPLLSDGGVEAVPVVIGTAILGIVTRSDLISALAREVARG